MGLCVICLANNGKAEIFFKLINQCSLKDELHKYKKKSSDENDW